MRMVWLAIALAAGVLEVLLPYFTFIFVSIAALLTFLASLVLDVEAQLVVFSISLVAAIGLFRPWVKAAKTPLLPSRADLRIGRQGVVTTAIETPQTLGRVLVDEEDWAARAFSAIALNRMIRVIDTDGIVLIVEEI